MARISRLACTDHDTRRQLVFDGALRMLGARLNDETRVATLAAKAGQLTSAILIRLALFILANHRLRNWKRHDKGIITRLIVFSALSEHFSTRSTNLLIGWHATP